MTKYLFPIAIVSLVALTGCQGTKGWTCGANGCTPVSATVSTDTGVTNAARHEIQPGATYTQAYQHRISAAVPFPAY